MTPEELERIEQAIKEAHLVGLQSGKRENSDLVDMIMHKMETKIEESINKNVNGKIKGLSERFDDYVITDNQWKDSVSPSIDIMKKIQNSSSVIRYVVQTVILLGVLVGTIIGLIKLFK